MDLELHQLDRKYERMKLRDRREESRLFSSLEQEGQRNPVVVVPSGDVGRYVLVDGFRRVRALERLGRDTVSALVWEEGEMEALVTAHHLHCSRGKSPLEEAYLVRVLCDEHGLSQSEIARHLGHTQSWVSRRLGLVRDLPEWLQDLVCSGELSCQAAMRCLLPMARAIRQDAEELGRNLCGTNLSTRQVKTLYQAWQQGNERARDLVVRQPVLALRTLDLTSEAEWRRPETEAEALMQDLDKVLSLSRRASRLLDRVLLKGMNSECAESVSRTWRKIRSTWVLVDTRLEEEGFHHDRPGHPENHSPTVRTGAEPTGHRPDAWGLPTDGEASVREREGYDS